MSLRRAIHNKKVQVTLDPAAHELKMVLAESRDSPIIVGLPPSPPAEPWHLAIMGYAGTIITFLDDF